MTPPVGQTRVPALDGLRGVAIFLVVFHHYVWFQPPHGLGDNIVRTFFPLCWTGVDLFFVLSGFLIGGILIRQRDKENYFKTFYLRRICRIFPFYFFWLALFFLLTWLLSPFDHTVWYGWLFWRDFSRVPWWSYVILFQNIFFAKTFLAGSYWMAVTWSLAVEEQFYLLLPLTIWLMPVRKLPYLLIALILISPLCRLYLYLFHSGIYPYVLLPCHFDSLLLGVLCACWMQREKSRQWLEMNQRRLYPALVILLAGTIYLSIYSSTPDSFQMVFWGYTWIALLYSCLLLIAVTAKKGLIVHFLCLPPLRNLGIIAYAVYLIHLPINILLHGLILGRETFIASWADAGVTLLAFLTTIFFAAVSWRFFEKPIIDWGHSFAYNGKCIRPLQ